MVLRIACYSQGGSETIGSYLAFCRSLLQELLPLIGTDVEVGIQSVNRTTRISLADFTSVERAPIRLILDPEVSYSTMPGGGELSATSPLGFHATWLASSETFEMRVSVTRGAVAVDGPSNVTILESSAWSDEMPSVSGSNLEAMWNTAVRVCEPSIAVVTSGALEKLVDPEFSFDQCVGWWTYLAGPVPEAINVPGILRSELGGGVLFSVDAVKLGCMGAETVRALSRLQQALAETGEFC